MKIEVDVYSNCADKLVREWLKAHREMCLQSMRSPIEVPDGIVLLQGIDAVLAYMGEE